jgi:hypothetical protein
VIVYEDGTPRTKHPISNLAIEVDEEAGAAVSRSYFRRMHALVPARQPFSVPPPAAAAAASPAGENH